MKFLPTARTVAFAALVFASALTHWAVATEPKVLDLDEYALEVNGISTPEGIWELGRGGAVFEIVASAEPGAYTLVLLDSPDYTLNPGTVFGTMRTTGKPRCFDAALLHGLDGRGRKKTRNFIIEVSADFSQLTFRSYRKGITVNLMRWLPYLYRFSVKEVNTRPTGIDGARRISPCQIELPVTL